MIAGDEPTPAIDSIPPWKRPSVEQPSPSARAMVSEAGYQTREAGHEGETNVAYVTDEVEDDVERVPSPTSSSSSEGNTNNNARTSVHRRRRHVVAQVYAPPPDELSSRDKMAADLCEEDETSSSGAEYH